MRFEGRNALVTGASKGIGRGIALRLASEGADLALGYYPPEGEEDIEDTAAEIEAMGRRAVVVPGDLADPAGVREVAESALAALTSIDILVNNAGITLWRPFTAVDEALWDRQLDSNLKSQFFLARILGRRMANQRYGRIVNIGSVLGRGAQESVLAYSVSKAGIEALTRGLALELGPFGITVNCVAPGPIENARNLADDPEYADHWSPLLPVGRVGYPEDVAAAVAFFAAEECSFVTGQVLYVDGGLTATLPRPSEGRGRS
ncbi:MAG TPA: SDR family oxidoreductase [Chloroflexota bacterium]|nr:SDR family oxidoreductase [Chloroflexota bacterium]